ncbi:MAG: Signal peptidase I [Candidatus Uhrbacteria bacterium GW2011_GWF2_39_13]|uniref:Signal peptidase I n=1 Tax=Candidatus Uhrbacteria bacterium GW2011_GWF2_39_13 TaxID=1618995 RepID=A0A0G0MX79_9BACT|nr:MAG: Signal peptidase I [Candidatus Uhrbacteria bacterium GW2011_GWF2_39_13]HAU66351.1 signal peptidase I [Candidatus Uhrbacteria bacterium]
MQNRFSAFEDRLYQRFGPIGGAVASFFVEVIQIVLLSSAIIIPIRYFLIQPFYVKGASMEPNFYDHEYLIIDELSYRFREPIRGEIVVFHYPRDPSQFFIKRVIGLPGETVEVTGGNIIIYNTEHPNGLTLEEDYLGDEQTNGKERVTLGENEFFVFGDNRDASLDSRSFGPITRKDLIGRVWVRGLPFSRMGTFEIPDYNL